MMPFGSTIRPGSDIGRYAKSLAEKLGRNVDVRTTTALEAARAQFVVTTVEAQDYHMPPKYGLRLVRQERPSSMRCAP